MKNILIVIGVVAYIMGGIDGVNATTQNISEEVIALKAMFKSAVKLLDESIDPPGFPVDIDARIDALSSQAYAKADLMKEEVNRIEIEIEKHKAKVDDGVLVNLKLTVLKLNLGMDDLKKAVERIKVSHTNNDGSDPVDDLREVSEIINAMIEDRLIIEANEMVIYSKHSNLYEQVKNTERLESEIEKLSQEIANMKEETNKRFEEMNRKIEELLKEK
ncbi:MAG: hypothetical protein LBP31_03715 [Holosporales bacterium]|nr:hypothetical protein [Holosporales bacterium]